MAITPQFLDELRQRLDASQVVGRRVKLVRKGREFSGLCPFHKEKTPSFTVNDEKSFYHCFGCGAHGDIVRFTMETEGLSFPESVERLAAAAGMVMPVDTPEQRQAVEKAKGLLMAVHRVEEEEAFGTLRKLAMDKHRSLGDTARDVIAILEKTSPGGGSHD